MRLAKPGCNIPVSPFNLLLHGEIKKGIALPQMLVGHGRDNDPTKRPRAVQGSRAIELVPPRVMADLPGCIQPRRAPWIRLRDLFQHMERQVLRRPGKDFEQHPVGPNRPAPGVLGCLDRPLDLLHPARPAGFKQVDAHGKLSPVLHVGKAGHYLVCDELSWDRIAIGHDLPRSIKLRPSQVLVLLARLGVLDDLDITEAEVREKPRNRPGRALPSVPVKRPLDQAALYIVRQVPSPEVHGERPRKPGKEFGRAVFGTPEPPIIGRRIAEARYGPVHGPLLRGCARRKKTTHPGLQLRRSPNRTRQPDRDSQQCCLRGSPGSPSAPPLGEAPHRARRA